MLIALVPTGVVTLTSTVVPDVPAGLVTNSCVSLMTMIELGAAAVVPKATAVAAVSPDP
jgi:hypothetical protein